MFSHVMLGAEDLAASKAFYDATLGAIGVPEGSKDPEKDRIFYITDTGIFIVSKPINGEPASGANGGTLGFAMASPEQVEAWHAAGIANGGTTCEDPPGKRESPLGPLYLAYLRDPAGTKLCALHRMG